MLDFRRQSHCPLVSCERYSASKRSRNSEKRPTVDARGWRYAPDQPLCASQPMQNLDMKMPRILLAISLLPCPSRVWDMRKVESPHGKGTHKLIPRWEIMYVLRMIISLHCVSDNPWVKPWKYRSVRSLDLWFAAQGRGIQHFQIYQYLVDSSYHVFKVRGRYLNLKRQQWLMCSYELVSGRDLICTRLRCGLDINGSFES